ncbi:MAG TPA: TMEM175 family protein [Longimicrobiaceae bacterium]|nr:TMEM175 family protein [Longimicrobiaceae bacterium]
MSSTIVPTDTQVASPASADAQRSETVRVEAFSDGVFAIAITLLIIEVRVPPPDAVHGAGGLWRALVALWPSYLAYAISFLTIGIMWINHHNIFNFIARSDHRFMILNVLYLMCIAFMPFPTAVLAENLPEAAERSAAAAFYSGAFLATAVAYNRLWWYARRADLLASWADARLVGAITGRFALAPAAYLVAFALAFVSVPACLAVHGLLAAFFMVSPRESALQAAPSV